MRFVFYPQHDSMDCGPTCLKMITKHYGKSFSLQFLRDKTQIGNRGVNLLGISDAAEMLGFRTQAVKIPYATLSNEARLPAILHFDQNHFVVLFKIKGNKHFIADPAKGVLQYSKKEFKNHWISEKDQNNDNGIALLLEPDSNFLDHEYSGLALGDKPVNSIRFSSIYYYLDPYRKLIMQLLLGLLLVSILQSIIPFLAQSIVDVGINTKNLSFVAIVLLGQMALIIGKLSIDFIRTRILLHISVRVNISILTDFLIKLMKLPVQFFDTKRAGDILQRMNDHQRIESFLTGSSVNTLFSIFSFVIYSVILLIFNSYIFFIFIIASVFYSTWVLIFLKKRRVLDSKRFALASSEQSSMIQIVQGIQEIKLNNIQKKIRWSWEALQAGLFKLSIKGLAITQWQQSGAGLINESKNIFITFISAKSVIDGQMTIGSMLAIQYMIGQLNSPIDQMIGFIQSWQYAKISMERLNEVHKMNDEEPTYSNLACSLPSEFAASIRGSGISGPFPDGQEAGEKSTGLSLDGRGPEQDNFPPLGFEYFGKSSINFNNVSFAYPGAGNETVLKNINLKIPLGKTTAIVGSSGSGKTTIVKLLLKLYQPTTGEIRLNDTSLATISHRVWRNHCGAVMQESFIFSDTITANIAVAYEKVDSEKLYAASKLARIDDFVQRLPLGFNTKIGAEGVGISMGQRQRILIARAIYRNPDFIFLDEATNSLDANNERTIVQGLSRFLQGKTVLVVAHRLSTVRNADQIIVINKGEIVERGSHNELVRGKGEYYTLVKNQLELGQ